MLRFLENIGDYFATNYFDEDFPAKVFAKSGYAKSDHKGFNKRISALKERYFKYKQNLLEGRMRTKDQIKLTHDFHTALLNALGFAGNKPQYDSPYHLNEKEVVPVRNILYRGEQPYLFIMEMQSLIQTGSEEPKGIFEQVYHRSQWDRVFEIKDENLHLTPSVVNDAISALFLLEQHKRPHYILLLAGNELYLLQYEKWFKGSYLRFQLEELFSEATSQRDYYSLFYFLLSKESLAPAAEIILMEQLDEDSHKSAYAVTRDLKEGIIHAVEALANEAVWSMQSQAIDVHELDEDFAQQLKDDCLTMVYRLLFLFYAESRPDLEILPINDAVYQRGYSLEMLRDLEQNPLNSEHARNSYFFHDSLSTLFRLLGSGYRENDAAHENKSFRLRYLDSPFFDNNKLHHLQEVRFRNYVWQEIIRRLSLSRQQRGQARGRISYANLGVNQLGSVYEGLLAYRGFFVEEDYIEVHKAQKPEEGTYLVPRTRRGDFKTDEILVDDERQTVVHPRGTFIYRLNGRDRQKSASFYTPEVLTKTTVKYTLKPILERLEKGEVEARELLRMKVLEPAMGAAAFHNEVINQLAEAYLNYRQEELKQKVKPGDYQEELQKVKAWIATNNVYGVDLNPTAVELGKLALWLNVIHRDMETPFFGYRLGVGNAVVGTWLKVYREGDFIYEPLDKKGKRFVKKHWWEKAPTPLTFGTKGPKRRKEDIYHFVLPDKSMVPSAGIKLLKKKYPDEYKVIKEWRKDFIAPIRVHEYQRLQIICQKVDALLMEHYRFQAKVNACTQSQTEIWGAKDLQDQCELDLRSYEEKERLAANRSSTNAPYFKLKMVMDYWCAFWYWDMRQAAELPTREEWYNDLINILDIDLEQELKAAREQPGDGTPLFSRPQQGDLFGQPRQLTLTSYRREPEQAQVAEAILDYGDRRDTRLFTTARRRLVEQYAQRYRFFHYQLEFVEVFQERGGFEVIVGNPPWVDIQFEESEIIAEKHPEFVLREENASAIRKQLPSILDNNKLLSEIFVEEALTHEGTGTFMNAYQNYPLLVGQRANLYKTVLVNTLRMIAPSGFVGLIHPEGIYDDPKGKALRKEVYQRLKYHFQFKNEFVLFAEVHHETMYGLHIFAGNKGDVSFYSVNNLFHPSTIDSSFVHNGEGIPGGYKILDPQQGKMVWNIHPHCDRIIKITPDILGILARTFEDSDDWASAKLVSIHSQQILRVLEKLSHFPTKAGDMPSFVTDCWNEVTTQDKGIIRRETRYPSLDQYELIYSGPHFFVGTPLYKTPREECKLNSHYDVIDLTRILEDYVPRTNYVPDEDLWTFRERIKGLKEDSLWIDSYRLCFRRRLSISGERTLQPAIVSPKVSHVHPVISVLFADEKDTIELAGLSSSILYDFYIKSVGKGDLYGSTINGFPMGLKEYYVKKLALRTLLLNCLTRPYAPLWERQWQAAFTTDSWSKSDPRLKGLSELQQTWSWATPLRNAYERRWALVEIDVLTAMALGLSLEELVLIYQIQFPVLQQNEDDTWYDQRGNIVFTCSKGLTGVGLTRKEWNHIRQLSTDKKIDCSKFDHLECNVPGEITYTITKSELYAGEQITYYAPFDRCDRVEDYGVVWAWFVGRLGEE